MTPTNQPPNLNAALAAVEKSRAAVRAGVADEAAQRWLLAIFDELEAALRAGDQVRARQINDALARRQLGIGRGHS
jgi:hypothetical protein